LEFKLTLNEQYFQFVQSKLELQELSYSLFTDNSIIIIINKPKFENYGGKYFSDMNTLQKILAMLIMAISLVWSSLAYTAEHNYDSLNRLISTNYATGQIINYTYDSAGNIINVQLDISAIEYKITGKIQDSNGNPLSGVLIKLDNIQATTDDTGYFQLNDLNFGDFTLSATLSGYTEISVPITISKEQPIQNLNLSLEINPFRITGHIQDANGNPVAYVLIKIGNQSVYTDYDGNYEIENLSVGDFNLNASEYYHIYQTIPVNLSLDKPVATVNFTLERGLTGKVEAKYTSLEPGEPQTCTDTITNSLDKTLYLIELRQQLYNLDTNTEIDTNTELDEQFIQLL